MNKQQIEILHDQLHRVTQLIHRGHHQIHKNQMQGMMHGQGRLLATLTNHNGASQNQLVQILGVRPASLSELIDKLERADLVVRKQNPKDRRKANIFLTNKGKEAAVEAQEVKEKSLKKLFGALDVEEQSSLSHLLDKLNSSLEEQFNNTTSVKKEEHLAEEIAGAGLQPTCPHSQSRAV